jgi:sugar-specific transcriptional regulator TrmB
MSVYRRIGEELYKPLVNIKEDAIINTGSNSSTASSTSDNDDDDDEENEEIKLNRKISLFRFIKSDNSHIRLLSCLIIIRTLNQVDYLVNVFNILRTDLNDETNKKLFIYYYGVWVLLKWCKFANKVIFCLFH